MSHIQYVDELIREYLLYRGFSGTLKVFDSELKVDKDKGFRVDRILDQLMQCIYSYDLVSLRELWSHLDQRMFSKLDQHFTPAVRKLENSVLKMYLVNAVLNGKQEKLTEFFTKMTSELLTQAEWKEWFMLPFIKNPEENPAFTVHFTRQWQDSMLASLHNFLSIIFQCMPQPTLSSFGEDAATIKCLQEENEVLRTRLALLLDGGQSALSQQGHQHPTMRLRPVSALDITTPEVPTPTELMDDFYVIAQETPAASESQTKTFKSLIRNIGSNIGGGLPTSPILGRKPMQHHSSSQQMQQPGARKLSSSISLEEKRGKTRGHLTGSYSMSSASSMQGMLAGNRLLGLDQNHGSSQKRNVATPETKAPDSPVIKPTGGIPHGAVKHEQSAEVGERREKSLSSRAKHQSAHDRSTSVEPKSAGDETSTGPESSSYLSLDQEKYLEHRTSVTQCKFNMSGTTIASSDIDGVVKVWSVSPSPKTHCTINAKASVLSLDWLSKTERYLIYGTRTGVVRLFDTREKKNVWDICSENSSILRDSRIVDLCCSPTESNFVCSAVSDGSQGKLLIYDIKTKKLERTLPIQSASASSPIWVTCSAFNHNGQLLVAGCNDGYVRIFDLRRSDCIDSWCAHKSGILSIQLSNLYTFCYTLGQDGKFCQRSLNQPSHQIWETLLMDTGVMPFHSGTISNGRLFTFDPSGSHMLICGPSGGIIYQIPSTVSQPGALVTMGTPKKELELGGHRAPVVALDWSGANDCTACVTASSDGNVCVSTLLLTQ